MRPIWEHFLYLDHHAQLPQTHQALGFPTRQGVQVHLGLVYH
jgi:hypothetical protein